jgi:thiol-disulfide isomerase/thioredoxin
MKVSSGWACAIALGVAAAFVGPGKAEDKAAGEVKLERLNWGQLQKRLANPGAKYTIVDAWSTTCGPCKENFPHVIEMHKKYAPKGLAVISLSLDDPSDKAAVAEAERFLKEKKAAFTNILLDENFGDGFDRLNINAIPAVFIFGPDGKEVKRFTMDDPRNQFTYDEVEKAVAHLLDAK